MAEEFVQRLGKAVARRKLLARVGSGVLGAVFVVVGLPDQASAAIVRCCSLCKSPTQPLCCGARAPFCAWAWNCCYAGTRYRCTETYCSSGSCTGSCTGVTCSHIRAISSC